ncbi:hypothetical protein [Rhizobium sp. SL86]|uniref:hypothetical protein n=1 Tax=Rhizobium sp. SL86 TaxID=2995148 RepID=UPI002276B353|nr:hypothetical protein [Rhizobium sp. SL86]MCY1668600.1 hypothetical protein [Rhizobium sp. SL86]
MQLILRPDVLLATIRTPGEIAASPLTDQQPAPAYVAWSMPRTSACRSKTPLHRFNCAKAANGRARLNLETFSA